MKDCSICKMRKYCKQAYRIKDVLDSRGNPYDGDVIGYWLYDYVARAYNHDTKQYEVFRGRIRVKADTKFTTAIAASIRGQEENAWFCSSARLLG